MRPVVVLTFANDNTEHLPMLQQESKKLMQVLSPLHDKDVIEVYREESADTDEVIEIFHRFDQRICIFHYAGHADGQQLHLEKGAASAAGLAQLFEQQKSQLKLVFLNGCATKDQVDQLLKLGVPAVIATSSVIQDHKAAEFAEWFYRGLSVWRDIQNAFDYAAGALNTKYSEVDKPQVHLFRDLVGDTSAKADQMPWGLYLHPDRKDLLQWTLPEMPRPKATFKTKDGFVKNDYLQEILHGMIEQEPSIEESLYDRDGEPIDEREYMDIIIKNFPWTIGAQLQKLAATNERESNQPHLSRLQQISSTYVVSSQLVLYILLSQIWDEVVTNKKEVSASLVEAIQVEENTYLIFDYLGAFLQHLPIIAPEHLFIPEFIALAEQLSDKQSPGFQAYMFLESLKEKLFNNKYSEADAAGFCEEAEFHLASFLSSLTFFVKYRMLTVRDIQLVNHRHTKDVEYLHKMGSLNAYTSTRLSLFREPRQYINQYTNSGSIILVKSLKDVQNYLSLSPFIIDKNTFTDISQNALNIYIYSFFENGEYIYHNVNTNIYNEDQHRVGQIITSIAETRETKRNIHFNKGFQGVKKMEKTLPFAVLKTQFEEMNALLKNNK